MPEYLAPGVYVEEVSFRSKSIEGVPTSTTGFARVARFGPVQYDGGPSTTKPRLITSFTEYERVYGGLAPLDLASGERISYMAHAVRAFFNNGGRRVYISRVFAAEAGDEVADCRARLTVVTTLGSAAWVARWPGQDGNVLVETKAVRTKNLAFKFPVDPNDPLQKHLWGVQVKSVRAGAVVELTVPPGTPPTGNDPLVAGNLFVVQVDQDGRQSFVNSANTAVPLPDVVGVQACLVELRVTVTGPEGRVDSYEQLAAHPDQRRDIAKVLEPDDPEDENA